MVHVYNCHPFASQQIVPTEQEPGLVCCGGDALFVVSGGGCKIEAFQVREEGCTLICRFSAMGKVQTIAYCETGDYLVTIEEKNQATYLRAYTNWRHQAAERTRVGVRLLGHFLRGPSVRAAPREQMEIIEIPLREPPACVACCGATGGLLVGCADSAVVFGLRGQALGEQRAVLDFERVLVLHTPGWTASRAALCGDHVALQRDLDVLVVRLRRLRPRPDRALVPADTAAGGGADLGAEGGPTGGSLPDPEDFYLCPRNQELLGEEARECGVSVTLESTSLEQESRAELGVTYVLYRNRRFAPDFSEGCSVEDTRLHSLQLLPIFAGPSDQDVADEVKHREPTSVFCFFSLPNTGYLYSIESSVELVSTYLYPEKAQQAALTGLFLHVITRNALMCFSVRCGAVAARCLDPYIDTMLKSCPYTSRTRTEHRLSVFLSRTVCHWDKRIFLAVGIEPSSSPGLESLLSKAYLSKKLAAPRPKEPEETSHGWNLYLISTVPAVQLYREMVEYSKKHESANLHSQSSLHLLSEAHLLLRAALLDPTASGPVDKEELQAAFQESCALLGDCYSRFHKRDSHLALPYYKMSGLSMTEIINRNLEFPRSSESFGKGFLFFLKHALDEETTEELSTETADKVLEVLGAAEPSQLPHAVCSPAMRNASAAGAFALLDRLEAAVPSVAVSLSKAAVALRMGSLQQYKQHMDRHAEMLQVYGFLEEPRLLLLRRAGGAVAPTELALWLRDTQEGLLVAAAVALHENGKVKLEEADAFFQELCKESRNEESGPQLLVDFWEALVVASAQEAVIQDLLFRLASVYIDRVARRERCSTKPLKTAEDLISSCPHYGLLFPWVSIVAPARFDIAHDYQEDLQKLQSLLCGPSLGGSSVLPLLEQLSDGEGAGLSVHLLCATKLGQHESCIDKLLDSCPEAIVAYAHQELQSEKTVLWWQKLLPELCRRSRSCGAAGAVLLSALRETLQVVSRELGPLEFLQVLPSDGSAEFFLPYLLECSQRGSAA
uniref:HPS3 biogenesis of lysosomal organelles complex 2 subunit 1 n=1 Tax=Lepisosteus oculatus TaxID=7918 RepID=W5M0H8_LEPOC